jgi:hypothetical protein
VTLVTIKTVIDRARAIRGCSGMAVFANSVQLYNDAIDVDPAVLLDLLQAFPDARRVSAAAGGFTFVAFKAGDYTLLLKMTGRFPVLPPIGVEEPSFVDPSCAPALPSREVAKHEAEAALRQFGLLQ